MASGEFKMPKTFGKSTYMYSKAYWSSKGDVNSNTSTVTVSVVAGKNMGSTESTRCTFNTTISVSGANEPSSKSGGGWYEISSGQEFTVFKATFTVPHNDDGSKKVTITASIGDNGVYHASGSSGEVSLDTIARETDAPSFSSAEVEESLTISLSPKIKNAKHSIKLVFGNLTNWLNEDGSLGSSEVKLSGKSLPITIPATYYGQFNTASKNGTLYLYTYNGNTKIGSGKQKTFKITCNSGLCSPRIAMSAVDVNPVTLALTGDENTLVANASNILVTPEIQISDSDDKSAYLKSKKINNSTFTTETYTINKATNKTIELIVTNSRDKTTYGYFTMNRLVPYIPLTFHIENLYRPEPTTGEIFLEYNGKYYPGEFTNGLGEDTSYLEVGDELTYDNIQFTFPDDLYLSMQNLETNKKYIIAKTNEYELYYGMFDNSIDGDVSPYIEYSVWYAEIDGTNQMSPYYLLVRKSDGVLVTGSFINNSSIIEGANLGVITEVNTSDTIVYPYITEIGVNNGTFNTLDISWKYKPKSSDTYIEGGVLTPTINTEKNTYSGEISLGTNFDYKQQYDFIFYYKDKIINSSLKKSVTRGLPIFWWSEDAVHIIGDLYVEGEINPN